MPTQVDLPVIPFALQNVPDPGYGAADVRRYAGLGLREGVFVADDMAVRQRSGGPGMAVDVLPGDCLVQGDSITRQGMYHCVLESRMTGATELTVPVADGSLPRVDSVILEVKDHQHDGSNLNVARLRYLQGSASAGANRENRLGAPILPITAVWLADVEVAANQASVSDANIVSRRKLAATKATPGDVKFVMASDVNRKELGWIPVDGAARSRTQYSELFGVASNNFGNGNGSTTFNVGDSRGRASVGAGTGPGLTNRPPASKFGSESHPISVSEMPAHSHNPARSDGSFLYIAYEALGGNGPTPFMRSEGYNGTFLRTQTVGGGVAHPNVQPSIAYVALVYTGLAE